MCFPINEKKNLRTVYLNGVSIEIISQASSGKIKVRVRFVDNDNDVRWCGLNIELKTIVSPSGYSINLKNSKKLTLDQGLTTTRMETPITFNGQKIFTSPTVIKYLANSIINMEQNSEIIDDNNSTLILESQSRIEVRNGEIIIRVKKGEKLQIEGG